MLKGLARVLAVVASIALLAVLAVYVVSNTDWGRGYVQKKVVGAIQGGVHGILRVDSVSGNLLKGFTLYGLSITDSAGAPFIKADQGSARYRLGALYSKRIDFDNVRLVRPVIVIDRLPGGKWNYDRIFPPDTTTRRGPRPAGWGTFARFTDVTLVDGDITVRSPWTIDARLTGAGAADALRRSLGPLGRLVVKEVPGGYQKISRFHKVNASLPLLRWADPGFDHRLVDVASLSTIAEPFKPPAAAITSLKGVFRIGRDSVWWTGATASFPNSRISGDGRFTIANNDFRLRVRANPVAVADIHWIDPTLPDDGSGTLDFSLDWVGDTSVYVARNADMRLETAHLRGQLGVKMIALTPGASLHDTDMRFTGVSTRLVEQIFPSIDAPRQGVLAGRAKVEGDLRNMEVDADVTFDDRLSGRSRVVALGQMGFDTGDFNADNLRLTMRPVQVDLLREFAPELPLQGTLAGTATLNGSTTSRMTARADITLVDRGSTSKMTGTGAFRAAPGGQMANSWFDIDARVHPLALVTAGKFFPKAGLRGFATGPVRLTGTTRNLAVRSELALSDGGSFGVRGTLDLASAQLGYDLDVEASLFNANAIVATAPSTSITGTLSADGRGTDPATMRANIVADLQSSTYDTISVTSATVRLAAANGMVRIDTLAVEIPEGVANASGTFGLARGRSGEVKYHVDIDSLSRLSALIPPQEGTMPPRPRTLAQRAARARSDSARAADATEVERAVTGAAVARAAVVDTPKVVNRAQLSGSLRADGVATGNIHNFGARGTASGENIVARGNTVEKVAAEYSWTSALTPQSNLSVKAVASNVVAAGFLLDSVESRVSYQKPLGTVSVVVHQDGLNSYSANAEYTLNRVRNEARLNQLQLRFDTTVWASTGPSVVHWGTAGIDIEKLEMRNRSTGRLYVDGLIPREGRANLEVAVDNFAVEDLIALAQSDIDARGLVSLNIKAAGTAADPTFSGAFGTQRFFYNGTLMPEVHGAVTYADETLTGRVDAMREGQGSLLFAEGTVPINLALTGVTGSRFPTNRQIDLAVRADTLPLDLVPQFNTVISNLRGKAVADFKVAGTLNRPEITGRVALDSASALLVPLGINLTRLNASISLLRDTIVVDSLVGYSDGRIAVVGGIGIGSLRAPSFDLRLVADRAELLRNDNGNLTTDINVSIKGPFDNTHVAGNMRVRKGVLYVPESEGKNIIGQNDPALFSVLDTAIASNRELFPAQSPLLRNLRMDVDLQVDRDVFVRSSDFNIEVYSDGNLAIHVNRATESLVLDGILLSERGEYGFLSKRFDIRRGSATFVNSAELNPTIQITGGYEVRLPAREAINIEILIGGTLLNPSISLQSDAQPPIPQSDLLSYLAFGRSSSSLVQLEGAGFGSGNNLIGAGAALASQQLAAVALGVFADQLAGEAARELGADVFNISPADIQTDIGGFLRGTKIEFGKYYRGHTFFAVQFRPDPGALQRPGLEVQHRFPGLRGYRLESSFQPRYLLRDPTLAPQEPATTSVFGLFLIREWRF